MKTREIKFTPWNGNKKLGYKQNGYQLRKADGHPHANKLGYLEEHRLVMENQIGRYLIPRKELVHHINGVRDDNRVENLLLTNPKDHAIGHLGQRNGNGSFACASPEFELLKFRLYDKDRNLTTVFTLSQLISKTFRRGKFEFRGRFTGLKDKNGKEIYEGDIFGAGQLRCVVEMKSDGAYVLRFLDSRIKPISILDHKVAASAIVGNIYENSELLNGTVERGTKR